MATAQHQQLPQQHRANVYTGSNADKVPICELSPAQTLKHMAEQHQHKNSMGMQFTRSPIHQAAPHQKQLNMNRPSPNSGAQFPNDFNKYNVGEFMNNSVQFNKMMAGTDNNIIYAHHQHQQQKNQQQFKKQHYPPYGDGAPTSDQSCNSSLPTQQQVLGFRGNIDQFVGDEQAMDSKHDSRINNQPPTLQMKQTQQLNVMQQGPNQHNTHVSHSFSLQETCSPQPG